MTPFPWKQAIGFGMTPRELAYAIAAVTGRSAPLDRDALTNLMTRYPDELR